ncbi:hypothetical protein ACFL41_02715, partial [Gemmatimonadota bacterium]
MRKSMFRVIMVVGATIALAGPVTAQTDPLPPAEEAAVRQAAMDYMEGALSSDTERISASNEWQNPPPPQIEEVLALYARACGGDALSAIMTETRRGILLRGAGGPAPCEIVSSAPDRWCWTQTLAWGDRFRYGCDGIRSWVQEGNGVREMDPGQARDLQLLFATGSPLYLRELYPDLSVGGTEQVGERNATVLRARSTDGTITELAFDSENGLLLRVGEIFLEDYREIGNVTRPFRLRLGEMLQLQLTEIQHDLAVDDSLFAVPTTPLPTVA